LSLESVQVLGKPENNNVTPESIPQNNSVPVLQFLGLGKDSGQIGQMFKF